MAAKKKSKKIMKPEPRFINALDFTKAVQRIEARLARIEQLATAINDAQDAALQGRIDGAVAKPISP